MSKVRVTARQPNFVAHWGESARWRPGRRLYTWHIHASGFPQLDNLVHRYQDRLRAFDFLDPTWPSRLSLPIYHLGFAEDVTQEQAALVARRVTERIDRLPPPTVRFEDALVITEDSVRLVAKGLRPLRAVVTRAAKGIRADSGELPAPLSVVIAYANADGPIQEVKEALREENGTRVTTVVKSVSLDLMNRDYREYLWTPLESATYQVARHGE